MRNTNKSGNNTPLNNISNTKVIANLNRANSITGTEFIIRAVLKRANEKTEPWYYTNTGKPRHNAFIESLNGILRGELRNEKIFDSIDNARRTLALWLQYGQVVFLVEITLTAASKSNV